MVYKKDLDLQKEWVQLLYKIKEVTGKRPADLNAVLFLVGVQELGKGAKSFSKEEKQESLQKESKQRKVKCSGGSGFFSRGF